MKNRISNIFVWGYLVMAFLFCFEGFRVLFYSEEPKGNAVAFFALGILGFVMFFFKRKFNRRYDD